MSGEATDEPELTCKCGDDKRLRRRYDGATGKLLSEEWYCYSCDNARLWALARSDGK